MSDELKIVLKDVKGKFDKVIEAFNMVRETLDRHAKASEERFKRLMAVLKTDEAEIRKDLNERRENTELHAQRKEKAS